MFPIFDEFTGIPVNDPARLLVDNETKCSNDVTRTDTYTYISEETNDRLRGLVNLSIGHIKREIETLKKRFPNVDRKTLERVLKEHGGHVGKATNDIFRDEEEKKEFTKKFPGAFAGKMVGNMLDTEGTVIVYGWNMKFDPTFVSNPMTIDIKDDTEKYVTFQQVSCQILLDPDDEEVHHPNMSYFNRLCRDGEEEYVGDGEWGTDPNVLYDENHSSNPEKLVPTRRELEANLNKWKIPLLGHIPFIDTDDDGKRGMYKGFNALDRNQKKRKLPKGWTRQGDNKHNGLYYYHNHEDNYKGWEHPLDWNYEENRKII